jgi:hypothetical protein
VLNVKCYCCRFLSTGDSLQSIAFSYRLGHSTVTKIVMDTCSKIWKNLHSIYMAEPTESDWYAIAGGFEQLWQFPNCIGAIDGKHIVIQAPPNTGSQFYNYKGTFSIVLQAVVDANLNFRIITVGSFGRENDAGIFRSSGLGLALETNSLHIPPDRSIRGAAHLGPMPFVIVGDEAFPLRTNLMRPYPGRGLNNSQQVFNYRLCRARRTVENAFGVLASRWRMLHRRIHAHPDAVVLYIKAACVLHNYIQMTSSNRGYGIEMSSQQFTDQQLRETTGLGCRSSTGAVSVRQKFTEYFNSPEGSCIWQDSSL